MGSSRIVSGRDVGGVVQTGQEKQLPLGPPQRPAGPWRKGVLASLLLALTAGASLVCCGGNETAGSKKGAGEQGAADARKKEIQENIGELLAELESKDAKGRSAALLAVQWLPPGALTDLDAAKLDAHLASDARPADAVLAASIIGENSALKDEALRDRLMKLADHQRGELSPEDRLWVEELDKRLGRALASNCKLSSGAAWQKVRSGAGNLNVYLEVIRTCGGAQEQSEWYAEELPKRVDSAIKAVARVRRGRGNEESALRKLGVALMFLRATARLDVSVMAPLLKKYLGNDLVGERAFLVLLELGERNKGAVVKELEGTKGLRGLLLRMLLGDETVKPPLQKKIKRSSAEDLSLMVLLGADEKALSRLQSKLCSEKNPVEGVAMAEAILTAYSARPQMLKTAKTQCAPGKKPSGELSDEEANAAIDAHKRAIEAALADSPRIPRKQFELLPPLAVALAQRGEFQSAIAALAYVHTVAPTYKKQYLALARSAVDNLNYNRASRYANLAASLTDVSTEDAIDALWRLLTEQRTEDPLARHAGEDRAGTRVDKAALSEIFAAELRQPLDQQFVSALAGALGKESKDEIGGSRLARVVGYVQDASTVSIIVELLAKEGFHAAGVYGLARLLPKGSPELAKLLGHGSPSVRKAAAFAVGLHRSTESLATIRKMIASADAEDRSAARLALVWILSAEAPK